MEETAGIALIDSETMILQGRTEGWIAGLQMLAFSVRGKTDKELFISA